MLNYTWTIESVDEGAKTMIVEYKHGDSAYRLNIHQPPADADLNAWVTQYAPIFEWKRSETALASIQPGMSGEAVYEDPAAPEPEPEEPNVLGSWNEEYLRALIYQVLEEIKESQV